MKRYKKRIIHCLHLSIDMDNRPHTNERNKQMTYPQTDNCCTRMGWDEFLIDIGNYQLHVSTSPETEMQGTFKAFCHSEQEMISINGWLIDSIELIDEA